MKKFNLQLFAAETNLSVATDIEPAISIDHVSRIHSNIDALREVLGIAEMTPMASGTQIKLYKTEIANTPDQVGEGETIPLTKVTRKLAKTITLGLKKHRKATSAESIQRNGYNNAVNTTDDKLISAVQKDVKKEFFALLETGTGSAEGTNLQTALANSWAQLQILFEDEDVTAIHFVSSLDVAEYIGTANVTTQTAFGFTYIKDFLGLGTTIISPKVTKGKVISTAAENLYGVYIPANSGDVANTFGLTSDETGLIGMTHTPKTDNATLETLIMHGVLFYPERLDGVVVADISAE